MHVPLTPFCNDSGEFMVLGFLAFVVWSVLQADGFEKMHHDWGWGPDGHGLLHLFLHNDRLRRQRLQSGQSQYLWLGAHSKSQKEQLDNQIPPGVAGTRAIQDRANQVPYHGPYQEPIT